ncbi:uncharacterized protein [Eurosta solidaginis]|uniref:uncharacterized protein n=1 Tax=Eurosta solidaginis TaxID=178769 RepID=UPI0035308195
MPLTRSASANEAERDDLNSTIVENTASASNSIEQRLNQMAQKINALQVELDNSNRQLRETQLQRAETPEQVGNASVSSLSSVLTELNRTLSSSRREQHRKLYDLPEFEGRPEDWPMFKEAFHMTTEEYGYNDRQNIMRLQKAIKGKAKDTVECLLIHSSNASQVMKTLEDRFGSPDLLVKSQISKIRDVPSIADNRIDLLIPFATKVQNLASFLKAANCDHHLCNPTLMDELLAKLPVQRRLEWARHAISITPRASIVDLSKWLQELARIVSLACANTNENPRSSAVRGEQRQRFLHTNKVSTKKRCKICSDDHEVEKCKQFLDLPCNQRWHVARLNKLCFSCLKSGHVGSSCAKRRNNSGPNATRYTHRLLNEAITSENKQPEVRPMLTSSVVGSTNSKVLFKILPVRLYAGNKQIDSYAFFDEGSAITLMNENLANRLGLEGKTEKLTLQWFGSNTATETSKRVDVRISGVRNNDRIFNLKNVSTVPNLQLPMQTLNIEKLWSKYRHMKKLPICGYEDVVPELLIGIDNVHLGVARSVVRDGWKGPAVVRTKLGWVVYGSAAGNPTANGSRLFLTQVENNECNELNQMVKEFIASDQLGVRCAEHVESDEVKRAKYLLETTTVRKGDRFETGLLWKSEDSKLPSNRMMAEKRFLLLEKKFERDEHLKEEYARVMTEYMEKGYSRKLRKEESEVYNSRTWYIPHFAVYNPNKPGKLRLVFDAAAKIDGQSLNSALLSGPDQCQPLAVVLMKFRQRKIGVCADIVEMFHQVKIREEDQSAQRFLWRTDTNGPIEEYTMTVMTFGATCSPCSAQFVKNKNARDFQDQFPEAVNIIINNHYVDDLVHCFSSESEALKIIPEVVWVHKEGGFDLKRMVSNSLLVNKMFNDNHESQQVLSLDKETSQVQKVLGMCWDTRQDTLRFATSFARVDKRLLEGARAPTKREVLSITMSLFDPFGMAAEYSLVAKLILQLTWRKNVDWDEEIPTDARGLWSKWLAMLDDLGNLSIPRCYSEFFISTPVELHVFADASEVAFAAVAYWRVMETSGTVKLAFITGKTKCAPLKLTSIPRLELQSAVLATRLRKFIEQSHEIEPSRVVMWSDSKTTISWIKSDHRRYKPYVAHRVNEILDGCEPAEWRWLPSGLNPADFGTRIRSTRRESLWTTGPEFLFGDETEWPNYVEPDETKEELRTKPAFLLTMNQLTLFERYSSFQHMQRIVAWILRFRDNCTKVPEERKLSYLDPSDLKKANSVICRTVQKESYGKDYMSLELTWKVGRDSSLWRLTPYLDDVGVVRVNGRLNNAAALSTDARRPIILPKVHRVTNLIVDHYHSSWRHQNDETIIAELRRRYWIPNVRVAVKQASRRCLKCKKDRGQPAVPMMGQLPEDRVTPFVKPFTYVGLDYMGPFTVVSGRRSEKRWIALFTCLTTRAVHLEIARDLSTDTCLMCIRNFMNRRGTPVRIRSDNGTNFIGADRELKRQLSELENGKIADALSKKRVEWVFNCPLNPHEGGCWERLVRSVKRGMGDTLHSESLQEHGLYSLMVEAENILNSRPLTHIPLDAPTEEPLTPNHFLLGTANSDQTPNPLEEKLRATRKQWRKVQQLQHKFWKKWLAEYLPDLCRRTKWYQPVKALEVDDVVMVCDAGVHRSKWLMGRVTRVYPGKDSQVRAADVKTKFGTYKRPARMLAKLDVGESESS